MKENIFTSDWSGRRRLLREKRDRRDPAGAQATRRLGARPRKASACNGNHLYYSI